MFLLPVVKPEVFPIATLPYTFADGMFSAFITLNLVYSAQGEVFLSYEMSGICGVTYDGTDTSLIMFLPAGSP